MGDDRSDELAPWRSRMHPILRNERLSPNVTRLVLKAPRIAEIRQPGQFVIVHLGRGAERIPLTIADADASAGTISLVIQAIGKSTTDLVELQPGDEIADVAGPLGRPTELPDARARGVRGWRRGHRRHPADRPGAPPSRRRGHQHHRRPLSRVGHPRTGAGGLRHRDRLHRRRQLRPARLRDRGPRRRPRGGRRSRRSSPSGQSR